MQRRGEGTGWKIGATSIRRHADRDSIFDRTRAKASASLTHGFFRKHGQRTRLRLQDRRKYSVVLIIRLAAHRFFAECALCRIRLFRKWLPAQTRRWSRFSPAPEFPGRGQPGRGGKRHIFRGPGFGGLATGPSSSTSKKPSFPQRHTGARECVRASCEAAYIFHNSRV